MENKKIEEMMNQALNEALDELIDELLVVIGKERESKEEVNGETKECEKERIKKSPKFKRGDMVKVIDVGERYRTYGKWFKENATTVDDVLLLDFTVGIFNNSYNIDLKVGEVYKITHVGVHRIYCNYNLYAITDGEGHLFIVHERGLEKVGGEKVEFITNEEREFLRNFEFDEVTKNEDNLALRKKNRFLSLHVIEFKYCKLKFEGLKPYKCYSREDLGL